MLVTTIPNKVYVFDELRTDYLRSKFNTNVIQFHICEVFVIYFKIRKHKNDKNQKSLINKIIYSTNSKISITRNCQCDWGYIMSVYYRNNKNQYDIDFMLHFTQSFKLICYKNNLLGITQRPPILTNIIFSLQFFPIK